MRHRPYNGVCITALKFYQGRVKYLGKPLHVCTTFPPSLRKLKLLPCVHVFLSAEHTGSESHAVKLLWRQFPLPGGPVYRAYSLTPLYRACLLARLCKSSRVLRGYRHFAQLSKVHLVPESRFRCCHSCSSLSFFFFQAWKSCSTLPALSIGLRLQHQIRRDTMNIRTAIPQRMVVGSYMPVPLPVHRAASADG